MSSLRLCNINKRYPGNVHAVKDVNLEIKDKDFLVFVGPSGCGKSTTLRMIAGLEEISSGDLFLGHERINDRLPKDRDMAMVFQNYALYPHMSVYDNMAFGLKLRRIPKNEIRQRIEETARILEIEPYLHRKPKALSGGQRQRVAMGRAIVRNPNMFLLDEPLSNLDAALRDQIRSELIKQHKRLDATFIYVTHDQVEAMTLGTRIVVMRDGVVQQTDTPQMLYASPANQFVAGFLGSPRMNFASALVEKLGNGAVVHFAGIRLPIPEKMVTKLIKGGYIGKTVTLGIRPEHIQIVSSKNGYTARLEVQELRGADSILHLRIEDTLLIARAQSGFLLQEDSYVAFTVDTDNLHFFDPDTENAIG